MEAPRVLADSPRFNPSREHAGASNPGLKRPRSETQRGLAHLPPAIGTALIRSLRPPAAMTQVFRTRQRQDRRPPRSLLTSGWSLVLGLGPQTLREGVGVRLEARGNEGRSKPSEAVWGAAGEPRLCSRHTQVRPGREGPGPLSLFTLRQPHLQSANGNL